MKHLLSYFVAIAFMMMSPIFISCSDDSETQTPANDEDEKTAAEDLRNYEMMLAHLCEKDTLQIVPHYTPRLGEVLDNARPTVYFVGVESEKESHDYFNIYFPKMEFTDCIGVQVDATEIDYGKFGSVSYEPRDGISEWAVVNINLPELKDVITQLVFIPKAKWPTNAYSPYNPGDVLRENNTNRIWLCVQDWNCGHDGIVLSWDESQVTKTDRSDHYKSYTKVTNGSSSVATREAWNALAHFYYSDPVEFCNMYDYINAQQWYKDSGCKFLGGFADNLRYHNWEDETFQVGEMWDHKYYWVGKIRHVWEGSTDYVLLRRTAKMEGYLYLFESGNHYFKGNNGPTVPNDRWTIERRFGASGMGQGYTKVYPRY